MMGSSDEDERNVTIVSSCVNCLDDVPYLGIECAKCANVRLCLECFSLGAELGKHVSTHPYRFFYSGRCKPCKTTSATSTGTSTSIISTRGRSDEGTVWYEEEQIRLLKGLELYGYGNWNEIANHIATKTAEEAKKEYKERYIDGVIGQLTWGEDSLNQRKVAFPIDHTVNTPTFDTVDTQGDLQEKETYKVQVGPLSPSLMTRLPPLDVKRDDALKLGYMPKRDEFESEYDNDAEHAVSDLSFQNSDSDLEVSLKLAVVDMYVRRLRERAKVKKVVRDHQLVSKFFKKKKQQEHGGGESTFVSSAMPKPSTSKATVESFNPAPKFPPDSSMTIREHLQLYRKCVEEKLHPYAQLMTKKDYETFIDNLVHERDLKLRLFELYKYRSLGFTSVDQAMQYEDSKQPQKPTSSTISHAPKKPNRLSVVTESSGEETEGNGENPDHTEDNEEDNYLLDEIEGDDEDDNDFDATQDSIETGSSASHSSPIRGYKIKPKSRIGRPPISCKEQPKRRRVAKTKRFVHTKTHTTQIHEKQRETKKVKTLDAAAEEDEEESLLSIPPPRPSLAIKKERHNRKNVAVVTSPFLGTRERGQGGAKGWGRGCRKPARKTE